MSTNAKIKVIKKGEQVKAKETPAAENNTKPAAAREIVSTVTNWVTEFQQRRRDETKQAFEKLFSQQTQPTGV
jgi:uncharacterized membrane-anchored protein